VSQVTIPGRQDQPRGSEDALLIIVQVHLAPRLAVGGVPCMTDETSASSVLGCVRRLLWRGLLMIVIPGVVIAIAFFPYRKRV